MEQFTTFFMGGFECADHINRQGERINLLFETQHNVRVKEDYSLLKRLGISTVREGVCWSNVEKQPYTYDFSEVENRIKIATESGIQQLWSLCHFGYPDDLIPTHPKFTSRFVSLCEAFTRFYKKTTNAPLFINPINEISFLSWHSGDMRGTVPFAINSGFDIKYHLCKAAIEGSKIIKEIAPDAILFVSEPIIKIHAVTNSDLAVVEQLNEGQYQAVEMLTGTMCPELGGESSLVDFIGLNYYYTNQWVHNGPPLDWREGGHIPLSELLHTVNQRYNKPLVITETGHFGENKEEWLTFVTKEIIKAIESGVELHGACIYPVIDRPDWDNLNSYSKCGLWDMDADKNRIAHTVSLETVKGCVQWVRSVQLIKENKAQQLKFENIQL